jgi:hypothetical protein
VAADPPPLGDAPVGELLGWFFRRNGYVRRVNATRREEEGRLYHKGDEVRLVAHTKVELIYLRDLLERAGFKPGRPFQKGSQFRQPLYGREAVAQFLALIGDPGEPRAGR